MGGGDRLLEVRGKIESEDPGSDLGGGRTEVFRAIQAGGDTAAQIAQGALESPGRDRVPRRDKEAERFEPGEIGGFAAQPRVR